MLYFSTCLLRNPLHPPHNAHASRGEGKNAFAVMFIHSGQARLLVGVGGGYIVRGAMYHT